MNLKELRRRNPNSSDQAKIDLAYGEQRQIDSLVSVRLSENPWQDIKRPKLTGARAKGKGYERKALALVEELAPASARILHNPWFEFKDRYGRGAAQPDYLLILPELIYIFEIKLTQNLQATAQLRGLYAPLVKGYYKKPVALIEVFKHITNRKDLVQVSDLSEVKPNEKVYSMHWLP